MTEKDGTAEGVRKQWKVLIVDDEQVEREGLQAILLNHMPDLHIELAKNGTEAIDKAEMFAPDLVLMDIKMPGMSGLEAIEAIRERLPDTQFVLVTAYDQFEYARKALKFGVKDYLLKPSRSAEIAGTVRRVLDEIDMRRLEQQSGAHAKEALTRMLPVLESDMVAQLLYDHSHEVDSAELAEWLGGRPDRESFVLLLLIESGDAETAGRFHAALREKIRENASGWVGAMSGRQVPIILFRDAGLSYRAQASSMMHRIFALERQCANLSLFAGIGNPYPSLGDIRLSYQEAQIASADISRHARFQFYEDLPARQDLKSQFPDKGMELAFMDHIRSGQWDKVREAALDYADRWERNGFPLVHAAQRMLEMLWVISRVLGESGIRAEVPMFSFRMPDYRALRTEVLCELDKMAKAAEEHAKKLESDAVEQVKQYILRHSHEDLSLEQMSEMAGLSPFYFSKMFKEATGVNYIDFLTNCRMEKARALLGNPDMSLKRIALEVGYRDPNYFSRVFKKTSGLSPRDYRRKLITGWRDSSS